MNAEKLPLKLNTMPRTLSYILLVACCSLLASCGLSPQYQEHYNVPKNAWAYNFQPSFDFNITDTAAAYQLFFLIRHTDAYPYNNIWLMLEMKTPGDTAFQKMRAEIPLAEASGHWLGRGMGEIWEQRMAINTTANPAFFHRIGKYTIRLSQTMRKNPLPEVLQVGLRVEKLGLPMRKQ